MAAEPATSFEEEDLSISPEVCDPAGSEEVVTEDEAVDSQFHSLDTAHANEEDAKKKSCTSIVSYC